jgi:hypothetical protein
VVEETGGVTVALLPLFIFVSSEFWKERTRLYLAEGDGDVILQMLISDPAPAGTASQHPPW